MCVGVRKGLFQRRNGLHLVAFGKQAESSMMVIIKCVIHRPICGLACIPRKSMLCAGLMKLESRFRSTGSIESSDLRCRGLRSPPRKDTIVRRGAGKEDSGSDGGRHFMKVKWEFRVIGVVNGLEPWHVSGQRPGFKTSLFRLVILKRCPAAAGDGYFDAVIEGQDMWLKTPLIVPES